MCIVIHNPVGVKAMDRDWFDREAEEYDGAAGVMYPKGGRIKVIKVGPTGSRDPVYDAYCEAVKAGKPCTLQFRGGDGGGKYNAQPFVRRDSRVGWALQGYVDSMDSFTTSAKLKKSDAHALGRHFMDYFPVRALNDEGFIAALQDIFGEDTHVVVQTVSKVLFFPKESSWIKATTDHICSGYPQENRPVRTSSYYSQRFW